ncbi:glycine cleavage system aminomethyltransferase GcvT [Blastomonas marina]|uniref:glycine cleavage system aminomethyltransferase GcvT n=1 Tax=Blastomonas marina TaxID=1867408 RepID=UPI002AC9CC01|nr:glycine cleavage system aminomethyltransferase GcvT [Blastomonas marina]WPZ05201.1 glycine cleavage system aminomethyltransferase GcvT [Blastomonas marina]
MTAEADNSPEDVIETQNLPLDAWHRERDARMVEFAGYHMPIQYEGIIAEHLWTREHAGLFDVSHMGQLSVSGEGAVEALEAIMPGDFAILKPGRMRYSMLLDEDGGVLDDLMVTNAGDHYALVVNGACKWDDIGFLREHLPDEITLTHHEDQALLALQGPEAAVALARITPMVDELKFMQAGLADWNGTPLWISRSGYTGEDGFEISVPADKAWALAEALVAMDEVKPIGLGARDSLRLEAGLPLYGHDLTTDSEPVSAGLTFAISKRRRAEGGFHGADRILKLLENGTETKRVGLALDGRRAAREGDAIMAGDTQVGTVTSGGFAPSLGHPIAMGYVASDRAGTGTELEIDVRGKRLAATVVTMPFVPNRYFR